jgi:hypothetical protein
LLRDEEEPREIKPLNFKIIIKRSLTLLKMLFKFWEERLKHVHGTALDDLLGVRSFLHNGEPSLVDLVEEFGLKRHFLGDIT